MAILPYKLQLTKGFFVDLGQIARMLTYAIEHQDEGRIPPEAYIESMGVSASRLENLSSLATAFELIRPVALTPTELGGVVYDNQLNTLVSSMTPLTRIDQSSEAFAGMHEITSKLL